MSTLTSDPAIPPAAGMIRFAGCYLLGACAIGAGTLIAIGEFAWPHVLPVLALAFGAVTGCRLLALQRASLRTGLSLCRVFALASLAMLIGQLVDPAAARWSLAHVALLIGTTALFWAGWCALQGLRELVEPRREPAID